VTFVSCFCPRLSHLGECTRDERRPRFQRIYIDVLNGESVPPDERSFLGRVYRFPKTASKRTSYRGRCTARPFQLVAATVNTGFYGKDCDIGLLRTAIDSLDQAYTGPSRWGGNLMLLNWRGLDRRNSAQASGNPDSRVGAKLHTIMLPDQSGDRRESMTVRLADTDGQRSKANMLLSRMYSWRGYGSSHEVPTAPNCVTFTATAEEEVIGTLTLTVDSAAALAADRTFADVLDKFRNAPGAKLCELTRLAFDTSSPARPRLAALFHIIFIYGSMHYNCTDLFIEVNPRHSRFYERMLGFIRVGQPRTNESVNAPSQLMWLNVGQIRRYIDESSSSAAEHGRLLYSYFFSPREEHGIYARLAGLPERSTSRDGQFRRTELECTTA
jgi:hypothetical protein